MGTSPDGLARASARRPGRTLALWSAAAISSVAVSIVLLGPALSQEIHLTNVPESRRAALLMAERLQPESDTELFLVSSAAGTVDDPAFRAYVERLQSALVALGPDVVAAAVTYYQTQDPSMVSQDRRATILPTVLAGKVSEATKKVPALRRVAAAERDPNFATQLVGDAAAAEEVGRMAQDDLATGGTLGLVMALLLLVAALGGVMALGLPMVVNVAVVVVSLALMAIIGQLVQFSALAALSVGVFALAVAINQSVVVVARYRLERVQGLDPVAAAEAAATASGRVSVYAGVAVAVALAGMLLVPSNVVRSVAAGVILVVVVGSVASVTLVPAVLVLMGDRVERLSVRPGTVISDGRPGVVGGIARTVTGMPSVVVLFCLVLLLGAASQWSDLRVGTPSPTTLPATSESARAIGALAASFPTLVRPVVVAVDGERSDPAVAAGVDRLVEAFARDGMFLPATVTEGDRIVVISAPLLADPTGGSAISAVHRVRDDYVAAAFSGVPAETSVGGTTAGFADAAAAAERWLPIVVAMAMGAILLLLTVALRSVVLPVVAVLCNLLTTAAAFGLTAMVFHHGFAAGVLGLQETEHVYLWIPLMVYCVLVALSVDGFLRIAAGIRERQLRGASTADSVVFGMRTVASVVIAGTLVLLPLLAGIASGRGVIFQQGAFALAAGLLVDALVVRLFLVPATISLLGRHAWYLPRWLDFLPDGAAGGVSATAWTRDWSERQPGPSVVGTAGRR